MEQYPESIAVQNTPNSEVYRDGPIEVRFEGMPSIKLESYKPKRRIGLGERLALATRRRRFTLQEDWILTLEDVDYKSDLNGRVKIPIRHPGSNEPIVFDGASVPLPWLVGLLTIGILRPLGITLVASIVHDYAYKYGTLLVSTDGQSSFHELRIARHQADKLFRDIISTVNKLPPVGYIAWLAIRIGWLWVPYNNKRFTGKPPIAEYIFVILIGIAIYAIIASMGLTAFLIVLLAIYLSAYVISLLMQHYLIRSS